MVSLRIALLVFLFSLVSSAQRPVTGTVVSVIDGRTLAVQSDSGAVLRVTLQFIEVPETDQPLHQVVQDHLKSLAVAKRVQVFPRSIGGNSIVGAVYSNDVDLSAQMLR